MSFWDRFKPTASRDLPVPQSAPAFTEVKVRSPDIGRVMIEEQDERRGLDAPTGFTEYLSLYGEGGPRWVRACVDAIAEDTAAMVIRAISWRSGDEVDGWPHPALGRPNPFQTLHDLVEEVVIDQRMTGNAFLLVDSSNELWRLPVDKVRIFPDRMGHVAGYGLVDKNGRVAQRFEREQVIHIKSPNPLNRHWGVGPLQSLKNTILISDGEDQFAIGFMDGGARFNGYFKAPVEVDSTQANKMSAEIRNRLGGKRAHRKGEVMVLQGLEWVPMSASPKDAAWPEIRELTREEFMAVFKVPPVRLGIEGANYATDREQRIGYYLGTVFPMARRIARAINRNRLLVPNPDLVRIEFDESHTLSQFRDEGAIATAASTAVQAGILSKDEARARFYDLGEMDEGATPKPLEQWHVQLGLVTKNEARTKLGHKPKSGPEWDKPAALLPAFGPAREAEDDAPWTRAVEPGQRALPIVIPRDGHLRTVYERDWNRRQDERQSRLEKVVGKDTARVKSEVQAILKRHGAKTRAEDGDDGIPPELIEELLGYDPGLSGPVSEDWLPEIVRTLFEEGRLKMRLTGLAEDTFSLQDPRVREWIQKEAAELVKNVTDATRKSIRDIIDTSVRERESVEDLAKRLMSAPEVGGDTVRAERIARTETTTAAGYASKAAYQQAEEEGVRVRRRWLTIGDASVRDSHRIDGRTAGVDEAFTLGSGTAADYPGDPSLPARERINCRCDVVPEVIEVDE